MAVYVAVSDQEVDGGVDCGVCGQHGGIWGLFELVIEYREAIQYDLLMLGVKIRHLGTGRFGWDDFALFVKFMPASSQLFQAVRGPQWSPELHMLANILDALMSANWQRGGNKGPRPKPVKRPGSGGSERLGKPVAFERVEEFLLLRNGRTAKG